MRTAVRIFAGILAALTIAFIIGYVYLGYLVRPEVTDGTVSVEPASAHAELVDAWLRQVSEGTFPGESGRSADRTILEDAALVFYRLTLRNRSPFPIEWIGVETPVRETDYMVLQGTGAYTLPANSEGSLTITVLCETKNAGEERELAIVGYTLGTPIRIAVVADSETIQIKGERNK